MKTIIIRQIRRNSVGSVVIAWLGRGLLAGVQLVSVFLLLPYLGVQEYAVFATMTALITWYTLIDFGIGSSIQNFLSEARAKTGLLSEDAILIALNTLIWSLLPVVGVVTLLSGYFLPLIIGLDEPKQELATIGIVISAGFSLTALFGIVYRVWYAWGWGQFGIIIQGAAALVALLAFLCLRVIAPDSGHKVLLTTLAWVLPNSIAAFICYLWTLKRHLIFRMDFIVRSILYRASQFGFFSALAAGVLAIDYIVMSNTLPRSSIVEYNLLFKYFTTAFVFYSAILSLMWPRVAVRMAQKHFLSKKEEITIIMGGCGFIVASMLIAIPLAPSINKVFVTGSEIVLSNSSIFLFGFYFCIRVWSDTYAMFLQAANKVKIFLYMVPIQATIGLFMQTALSKLLGLNGIILGLIISFLLTAVWVLPQTYYKFVSKGE